MTETVDQRAAREIEHGRMLAAGDTEAIWGWTTPAGLSRARRRAAMIIDGAGLAPGVRAMEIGCGTGLFTEFFVGSGAHIVAVDISPELLEHARRRNLAGDAVQFVCGRFEECDLPGPFDAIVGSSVLHHLDVPRSVARIFELLRPGGTMAFVEPNMLNPQVFLERRLCRLPIFSYVSPDETAFVRWTLAALLERAGFTGITIRPHDWLHPATPAPLVGAVRRLGAALEWVPLVRELSGSHLILARRRT